MLGEPVKDADSNDRANEQPPTAEENPPTKLLVVGISAGLDRVGKVLKIATGHCLRSAALPV